MGQIMPPIPKPKKVWIIVDMNAGHVLEALVQVGVEIGASRWQGAPNLIYDNMVPHEAIQTLDELFEKGELLYGP